MGWENWEAYRHFVLFVVSDFFQVKNLTMENEKRDFFMKNNHSML